jgi:hypothetical protein
MNMQSFESETRLAGLWGAFLQANGAAQASALALGLAVMPRAAWAQSQDQATGGSSPLGGE